jgi:PadR family transcriptional regulator, regulatory protein PadR
VARLIQLQSEEVFFADHGLLYLALQRPEEKKWISAKWGVSENKRKSRLYSLTPKGRQQIVEKTSEWERRTKAMGLILSNKVDPSVEEAWQCSSANGAQMILLRRLRRILNSRRMS